LRATLAREAPSINSIRKIEGTETVYKYLDELPEMLSKNAAPFLVDCLNCEAGCNGGPATGNYGEPIDILESKVSRRSEAAIARNKKSLFGTKLKRDLKKYWKEGIYDRAYVNMSENARVIKQPNEAELQAVFHKMKKTRAEDMLNCSACGYGSCAAMANAIFNGLNKPENCHEFLRETALEESEMMKKAMTLADSLAQQISTSRNTLSTLADSVDDFISITRQQDAALGSSSEKMESLVKQIYETTASAQEKRRTIEELGASASQAKKDMRALSESFANVQQTTNEIAGIADVIEDVATSPNLLAMNAASVAAHAGESGRGFAGVAGEVR
jgi:RNA binding exosome subunit